MLENGGQPSALMPAADHRADGSEHRGAAGEGVSCSGRILYGSQTGTAARLAHQLAGLSAAAGVALTVSSADSYEVEQLWKEELCIFLMSTYEGGSPPDSSRRVST